MLRFTLLLLALVLPACGTPPQGPAHCSPVPAELAVLRPPAVDLASPDASRGNLRAWVDRLAAPELRGRHATSDEGRSVAAMLAEHMSALGLEAPFPDSGYCHSFALVDGEAYNVVGHLTGPAHGGRTAMVLGAHYDGQGLHPAGLVYPSADDNASGVAALLEVARLALRRRWPFDLVFIAFTAEEVGQVGAEAWVAEPTVPLPSLRLMINFDMVGRPWPGSPAEAVGYEPLGNEQARTVRGLSEAGARSGIEIRRLTELFAEDDLRSDSAVFRRHVPALYLSTGLHQDHHRRSDTAERVDVEQIARAVRLTLSFLDRSAAEQTSRRTDRIE